MTMNLETPSLGERPSAQFHVGIIALSLFAVTGMAAIALGFVPGHAAAVTPWGMLISTYVFFALSSTGLCLVSSLGHIFKVKAFEPIARRSVFLAIVTLLIAFTVMAMELARPIRLARGAVLSANAVSPIWWMGALYGLSLTSKALEFLLLCATDHAREARARTGIVRLFYRLLALGSLNVSKSRSRRNHRFAIWAGLAGLVASVAAPSMLGAVFGFISAKPLWHGPFMPIYFLVSALLSGAALLPLVVYLTYVLRRFDLKPIRDLMQASGKLLAGILGAFLFLTIWRTLTSLYGHTPNMYGSTMAMLEGELMGNFWVFEIILGSLLPLVILLVPQTRTNFGVALASALVIVGVFVARFDFVVTGQLGIPGEEMAVEGPNPEETLIVLVAFALCMLAYVAGERVLPISESHHQREHHEVSGHSPSNPGAPSEPPMLAGSEPT